MSGYQNYANGNGKTSFPTSTFQTGNTQTNNLFNNTGRGFNQPAKTESNPFLIKQPTSGQTNLRQFYNPTSTTTTSSNNYNNNISNYSQSNLTSNYQNKSLGSFSDSKTPITQNLNSSSQIGLQGTFQKPMSILSNSSTLNSNSLVTNYSLMDDIRSAKLTSDENFYIMEGNSHQREKLKIKNLTFNPKYDHFSVEELRYFNFMKKNNKFMKTDSFKIYHQLVMNSKSEILNNINIKQDEFPNYDGSEMIKLKQIVKDFHEGKTNPSLEVLKGNEYGNNSRNLNGTVNSDPAPATFNNLKTGSGFVNFSSQNSFLNTNINNSNYGLGNNSTNAFLNQNNSGNNGYNSTSNSNTTSTLNKNSSINPFSSTTFSGINSSNVQNSQSVKLNFGNNNSSQSFSVNSKPFSNQITPSFQNPSFTNNNNPFESVSISKLNPLTSSSGTSQGFNQFQNTTPTNNFQNNQFTSNNNNSSNSFVNQTPQFSSNQSFLNNNTTPNNFFTYQKTNNFTSNLNSTWQPNNTNYNNNINLNVYNSINTTAQTSNEKSVLETISNAEKVFNEPINYSPTRKDVLKEQLFELNKNNRLNLPKIDPYDNIWKNELSAFYYFPSLLDYEEYEVDKEYIPKKRRYKNRFAEFYLDYYEKQKSKDNQTSELKEEKSGQDLKLNKPIGVRKYFSNIELTNIPIQERINKRIKEIEKQGTILVSFDLSQIVNKNYDVIVPITVTYNQLKTKVCGASDLLRLEDKLYNNDFELVDQSYSPLTIDGPIDLIQMIEEIMNKEENQNALLTFIVQFRKNVKCRFNGSYKKLFFNEEPISNQVQPKYNKDHIPNLTKFNETIPELVNIIQMGKSELENLKNFSIFNEFVRIDFLEPVDLTYLDLDNIILEEATVKIEHINDKMKKLNKKSRITMYNFPFSKHDLNSEQGYYEFIKILQKTVQVQKGKVIEYSVRESKVIFEVEKYVDKNE